MTTNLDNVADALKYLHDQWDRQLKEEYQLGLEDGRKHYTQARADGHEDGYKDGYNAALAKIWALTKKAFAEPEAAPDPEPILLDAPASNVSAAVSPGLQRALAYVREHPGVTSAKAYRDLRNNSTLYTLAKRGLIEKRGVKFYPKDES